MKNYKEELNKICNTTKGFYELLLDSSMELDFLDFNHSSNYDYELYKNLFKFDCSAVQAKYFFKHLNAYFTINQYLTEEEKEKQIVASMLAFNSKPIYSLCNYLNNLLNSTKLSNFLEILKDENFAAFVAFQKQGIIKNENFFIDVSVPLDIDQDKTSIILKINQLINSEIKADKKIVYSPIELNFVLKKIAVYYEEKNKDSSEYNTSSLQNNTQNKIDNLKNSEKWQELTKKTEKITDSFNEKFETLEKYFNRLNAKYQAILDELEFDSQACRSIRTIFYIIAYITRNKGDATTNHMKQITSVDVGWAVGDEDNKNASFYGESEIAKAFAAYYAYMNAEENPYTELINNKYVSEMDYNAIMLHGSIYNNGILKLLFDGQGIVQEVHKTLKTIREIITLLDTPITFGGDLLGWLKGLVSSLTNSVATIIDLSLGELSKTLFFVPIMQIGDKKYSLSDIYNYISFIKTICENAENIKIGIIDRDEFISESYNYLGIDQNSAAMTGYFAYDTYLNSKLSPFANITNMFQNQYGSLFTAKNDMKLFYSLLQFAIQKRIYTTGDHQIPDRTNYSSVHLINNMIRDLTSLEVFYIFKLYGINFRKLKDTIIEMNNEKMLTFNEELFDITGAYDHNNVTFYEEYAKMKKNDLYEQMLAYDFNHSKYQGLISVMNNYYAKVVSYNKKQLDSAVFAANNISDVDDFFMRFIPSIIELGKTLGLEIKTFKQIASLLNSFCNLITEVLFKKLYLNLRVNLREIIKTYTDDMFEKLESKFDFLNSDKFTIDLDLGNNRFVKILDKVIRGLENQVSFDMDIIERCFKDFGDNIGLDNKLDFGDGTIGDPEGDYETGTRYPQDPSYDGIFSKPDKQENDINIRYEDRIDSNNNIIGNDFISSSDEYIDNFNNNPQDKIIYEKGNIIIEKPNGDRNIILSEHDNNFSHTDSTYQKLPLDKFEKLIAIRNFIENVRDKELVHIQNLIKKEEEKLKNELNKRLPNYGIIQEINKSIKDLTEELESVKNKNRTIYSESIVLKTIKTSKNNFNNSNDSYEDYSYLNDFFNKESIINDIEEMVIEKDSPLTNSQITALLK